MCDLVISSTFQSKRWRNLFLGLLPASWVLYLWGVCRTVLAIHNEDEIPIHPWGSQKYNHELFPYSSEHLCLRCLIQCKYPHNSFYALSYEPVPWYLLVFICSEGEWVPYDCHVWNVLRLPLYCKSPAKKAHDDSWQTKYVVSMLIELPTCSSKLPTYNQF